VGKMDCSAATDIEAGEDERMSIMPQTVEGWVKLALGVIALVAALFAFDYRYMHTVEAQQKFQQTERTIVFKDTQRQIQILDLKIKVLQARQNLSLDEQEDLNTLRLQKKILIQQLEEMKIK
jgi:hypothetical protein